MRPAPAAVVAVRAAAEAAADWASVQQAASGCVACPELVAARRRVVVGQWPVGARLALLGEAPGAEEDETGEPFVGRSGRLLDRLLADAGLPRDAVAVLNVLKCRPPANRKPAAVEAARCRGWLDRQLALVRPLLLVTLGGTATEAMLGRGAGVTRVRGRLRVAGGLLVLPTFHPSAALRFGPAGEPAALLAADLRLAAEVLATQRRAGCSFAPAVPDDAAELHALGVDVYGRMPEAGHPWGALGEGPAELAADIEAHGGAVARRDGRLVAGLRFTADRHDPEAVRVRRLAVARDSQRGGVGTALMQWAEALAASRGHRRLRLGARVEPPGALAFYAALGYQLVADHGWYHELVKDVTG